MVKRAGEAANVNTGVLTFPAAALSQKWGKTGNFGVAKYKNIKKNRAQEVVKRDGEAASVNTAALTLPA